MSDQLYLLKISAMSTCDDCDIVPSAEIIVDHDLSSADLPCLEALHAMMRKLAEAIVGVPLEGVRPMTRVEIQQYRDDVKEDCDVMLFGDNE